MLSKLLKLFIISGLVATPLTAEEIHLKDGSSFTGTILHYYGGQATVVLTNGDTVEIPRDKIDKVLFQPNETAKKVEKKPVKSAKTSAKKVDKRFVTPVKTFEHWQKNLKRGDFKQMAACFTKASQPLMLSKLEAFTKDQRKKMHKEAKKTKFVQICHQLIS